MRFQFLTYQNRWDTVTVWGLGGNRGWDRPTDYRVSDDIRYRPASDPQTHGDTQYNRTHVHQWVSRRLPAHAAVARKLHSPVLWALGGP